MLAMNCSKVKHLIIGCGIGGLAAAAELKAAGQEDFWVVDKCEQLPMNLHSGVHYLHTADLHLPFAFEVKEIISTEEIWNPRKDEFKKQSHVPEMIDYSMKLMGLRHPSSIMDPGNRDWKTYIPLSNNMNDLLLSFQTYIGIDKFVFSAQLIKIDTVERVATFNYPCGESFSIRYENLISTAPLKTFGKITDIEFDCEFKHSPLYIVNYATTNIVPNWLVSLYIADDKFPVYRITIMNNIMSMESLSRLTSAEEHITKYHLDRYFEYSLETREDYVWETGRIWGIDKTKREEIVKRYGERGIYLIGRFGTWDGKLIMDTTILQAKETVRKILS